MGLIQGHKSQTVQNAVQFRATDEKTVQQLLHKHGQWFGHRIHPFNGRITNVRPLLERSDRVLQVRQLKLLNLIDFWMRNREFKIVK